MGLMIEFHFTLRRTRDFARWYAAQVANDRGRIDARLDALRVGHFGVSRNLGDGLFELKWKNGLRVYFSRKRVAGVDILVLWGGFKGSQAGDIAKSRRLKSRFEHEIENEGPQI
ncbi:MAG: hypothetical protein ACHQ49_09765 [Elusimicrobiota bacterium]